VTQSPKVQDSLDKAKIARRPIIRYLQIVTDESFVGTLIDANEKVVEAIQLYDKVSHIPPDITTHILILSSCQNLLSSIQTLTRMTINPKM
jgi:hypothetical protein